MITISLRYIVTLARFVPGNNLVLLKIRGSFAISVSFTRNEKVFHSTNFSHIQNL